MHIPCTLIDFSRIKRCFFWPLQLSHVDLHLDCRLDQRSSYLCRLAIWSVYVADEMPERLGVLPRRMPSFLGILSIFSHLNGL
jgi:hypothetical protein